MTQVGGSDWAGKISARAHNEKRISLENGLWAADSCVVINPCPLRTSSRALLAPITCGHQLMFAGLIMGLKRPSFIANEYNIYIYIYIYI
ncbi:hypothetical protein MUK42_36428 [Musa troglodytarum]|uniref:Uncharacterized protein n=1 Tax=Musa troglodytarum TaxID=320322 RepID=A0A9E7KGB1_9LILI|nr:hypothetical protein MUK42_36428 [Musa troglodytarum]